MTELVTSVVLNDNFNLFSKVTKRHILYVETTNVKTPTNI